MMRRTSTIFLTLFSALAVAACSPTYPKCDEDTQCKEGEVCVVTGGAGQCQECRDDSNCGEGQQCTNNRCEAKPQCSKNADCSDNMVCKSGQCKQECTTETASTDCGDGLKCMQNRCVDQLACAGDGDCASGMSCINAMCSQATNVSAGLCVYPTVRFDFNKWALSTDVKSQLEGVADCLKSNSASLTIEGHADECGTEEYNLALGERRARAVRNYLRRLGVSSAQLEILSKGELDPVNPESNETAWAENRRAEFEETLQ